MNKAVKTVSLVAGTMLLMGVLLSAFAFAVGAPTTYYWDRGLRAGSYADDAFDDVVSAQTEAFSGMNLDTEAYRVVFERTTGEYGVSYCKYENDPVPRFHVENGVLTVEAETSDNDSVNFHLFGINNNADHFDKRLLTIRFPENVELTTLKLESDLNDLSISDLTADKINLELSLGTVKLDRVTANKLEIEAALGDVALRDCKVDDATLNLKMGALNGEDLETGKLDVDAKMGAVELSGIFRGKTTVDAQMGSVDIINRIDPESCFVDTDASLGDVSVHGSTGGANSPNRMELDVGMGSIDVRFAK